MVQSTHCHVFTYVTPLISISLAANWLAAQSAVQGRVEPPLLRVARQRHVLLQKQGGLRERPVTEHQEQAH